MKQADDSDKTAAQMNTIGEQNNTYIEHKIDEKAQMYKTEGKGNRFHNEN